MNLHTLETLTDEQFACGMGEVLKSGLIRDAKFYEWTINHMAEIQERIYPVRVKMIQKCCDIKRQVVEEDPNEKGIRAILNLGHTVGPVSYTHLWVVIFVYIHYNYNMN